MRSSSIAAFIAFVPAIFLSTLDRPSAAASPQPAAAAARQEGAMAEAAGNLPAAFQAYRRSCALYEGTVGPTHPLTESAASAAQIVRLKMAGGSVVYQPRKASSVCPG